MTVNNPDWGQEPLRGTFSTTPLQARLIRLKAHSLCEPRPPEARNSPHLRLLEASRERYGDGAISLLGAV